MIFGEGIASLLIIVLLKIYMGGLLSGCIVLINSIQIDKFKKVSTNFCKEV